ncbi:hypothetical protein BCV69DRAFT_282053 [Microstroma glucosiphilum]|uniref:HNH domain-containing protein n=1 Tax=Pseudomicrostroma glucosiphilum TaxID=1684307 RepID=A0A316U7U9_9BASI|nr:hypothetical protein BCV69DRAFT_282053 [Pseudomicrostroma glucosiphilum]PWN21317.1 hypothetical protein BCV69DRAFT_282053 [Pseudomicrostroma glucosiphilum]
MPSDARGPSSQVVNDGEARRARIEDVLTSVLTPWAFGQHEDQKSHRRSGKERGKDSVETLEDLQETIQYLTEEIVSQGVYLPSPPDTSDDGANAAGADDTSHTLQELESHPLHSLVLSTLKELLLFDEAEAVSAAPTIVEEILDSMRTPPPDPVTSARPRHKKGTLGECEICERMMPLTEHHLIPRSEHAKLSRQGTYTLDEMRSRLAMLCRPCHSAVHHMLPADDLASRFNTVEALFEHEGVKKWGRYASGLKERQAGYEGIGLRSKR